MENFLWTIALLVATLTTTLILWVHQQRTKSNKANSISIPKPPGAWPIVGHLPSLAGKNPPHRTLAAMSEQWGPVFLIQLGMKPTLIISSKEAAKECFTTNDHAIASRPKTSLGKHMGHDYAIFGLAPVGPYWREMRKMAVAKLLSNPMVEHFGPLRTAEIGEFIRELYNQTTTNGNSVVVNMGDWLFHLLINITTRMVARKRFPYARGGEEDKETQTAIGVIKEYMETAGLPVISDLIPIPLLEWLDLQGHVKTMKRVSRKVDSVVQTWIDEHRRDAHERGDDKDRDFIDHLLSQVGQGTLKFDQYSNETVIIATVETIFLGVTDSTSVTLTWALSLLINHPQVLKQAQDELDRVVGPNRWVEDSDMKNLAHVQAIVKETLRLYPPAPLLIPRETNQDCVISGYPIQKGTQVLVNIGKLQRDPVNWPNPNKFDPERFLSGPLANADIGSGRHFEMIPFGSGKRVCPGSETALRVMHLTIAKLIQGFEISSPDGRSVDMSEGPGLTAPKAVPLEIALTPRLPHVMYET